MEQQKKRERNSNFSREETDKLVSITERYKKVVENKKSDALTWQEKEKAWKAIETDFNSCGTGPFRDAKHLKIKFEAMKRLTRKKAGVIKAELYKTGGGVNVAPPLTTTESKIKQMILLSVDGDESIVDNDLLEADESSELVELVPNTDVHPVILEGPIIQTNDYFNTGILEPVAETPNNRRKLEESSTSMPSTSKQVDEDVESPESSHNEWAMWKPAALKSKKHPALCQPKEKRPFDKLAEAKCEVVELQRRIIEEEMEEQILKKQALKDEMQQKLDLYEMEKKAKQDEAQQKHELHEIQKNLMKLEEKKMLLEIEILETDLKNRNNLQ